MRKAMLSLVVLITVFFGINAFAGEATKQLGSIYEIYAKLQKQATEFTKEDEQILADNKRDIEAWSMLKSSWNKFVIQRKQLDADIASHQSDLNGVVEEIAQHNTSKPNPRDEAAVNSYNNEADRLNSRKQQILSREPELTNRYNNAKQLENSYQDTYKKMSEYTLQLGLKKKALNARIGEWIVQMQNLKKTYLNTCKGLLNNPATRDEAVKLKCGNVQFDNADPFLPPLNDEDIRPPSRITPNNN